MAEDKKIASNIDEYISGFPKEVQLLLQEIRLTIKKAAPLAIEKISWGMPTFFLNGNIAHFAAHKKHIGFYPGAEVIENFKEALLTYKTSKGAIQFPLDKPLPLDLVTKIIKYNISN